MLPEVGCAFQGTTRRKGAPVPQGTTIRRGAEAIQPEPIGALRAFRQGAEK